MSVTNQEIKKKVAVGTVWMVLLKFSVRALGIISTLILARLLLPEDYGIVAMAMAFYTLIEMLAAFGFDFMLIQKKNITREDYDSAFTAKFICYTILATIIFFSVEHVADFYQEPELIYVLYALVIQMFLGGVENIALVDFRREMLFDKEFKFHLSIKLIAFVVTVGLAFHLQNYWALVIGSISYRLASIVIGYSIRPYMPRICFTKTKEIMGFSKWLLLMNFASYFRNQLPNIALGRAFTSREVGLFSMGMEIAQISSQEIVSAMNRPVYSGFSKLADNLGELRQNFLEIVGFQALIVLATGFGVASVSEFLVGVALGDAWAAMGELLILLAIACSFRSVSSCCIYIYMAKNRPRFCFISALFGLAVFIPLIWWLLGAYGLMGVVLADLISVVIGTCFAFFLVSKVLEMSMSLILSVVLRPLFGAVVMFYVERMYVVPYLIDSELSIYLALPISIIAGGVVYTLCVLATWVLQGRPDSAESTVINWGRQKFLGVRPIN